MAERCRRLTASPDTYLYLWDLSGDAARARDLARLGRLAEAEAAYARAVERRPRDLTLRLDRARFYARQRQWDKAADDFAAVLQVQADQPQLWLECGRWNAEAGRWDQVAADFDRALELVPEDINQFSQRNQIAVELAQWDQAFARAVELRPKDGMLWIGRGRYLGRRGRWKEAAEAYARVIATRPLERNEEWYEYACLLLLAGDTAGYRRFCQEQIARAGTVKDPFLAYVLARTCGQAPGAADPAQVVRWGEQAVRSERNAWFLHTLGLALYRAGQYEQAIKLLEESDRANWGQRTLLNWLALALAHHRLGHAAAARRWLDKATAELKRVRDAKPNELADFPITDWLEAEVLRREAEEGIGASSS